MMKRLPLILLGLLCGAAMALAVDVVDAQSKLMLTKQQLDVKMNLLASHPESDYQVFINVSTPSDIDRLRELGVKVEGVFGGIVTARVPFRALPDVAAVKGVTRMSLAKPLQLCNDRARSFSHVDEIHDGVDQIMPFTGKGVIVGVIDVGIDFNHINLLDADGKTRVRAVYMPCDSTGNHPVIEGDTLPGSYYESPQQIAALTTDYDGSSHGTHTTGTAVGSYRENGLHGMAPEADIVACGMPSDRLTDANVANAVKYIFDYADRVGKPCVINMSLGTNEGPNDGSSFLCRVFDSMSGPGRICVLSAGNDGNAPICFHHSLQGETDTVTTLLRNQYGGLKREGYVSMWSNGPQEHRTRMVIINRQTGAMEYASPFIDTLPEDSVYSFSSDTDPDFAVYYSGEVFFANALEPCYSDEGTLLPEGRYHSVWSFDVTSLQSGHLLGLQYVTDEKTDLSGWCTRNTYFYTFGLPGMTGGSTIGSISDLATSGNVISVGAYDSRSSYTASDGSVVEDNGIVEGAISAYSSYGPDERGINRPDVCAPGSLVLSSANRYDQVSNRQNWLAGSVVDGIEYPYYSNKGTSMSAPVVAGTIALLLQVSPELTATQLRDVFYRTSARDDVASDDSIRWGSGKLDARAALQDVIAHHLLPGDVNNDHEVNIGDISALVDILIGSSREMDAATLIRADVNRDNEIQLADINCVIDLILK
jgi:subtilisin family serine protease